jgi:uncharacterized membrane protein YozB (DUF420 family)
MMYSIVLAIHNILRWAVLILGILAVVRAWSGWIGKREWTERDRTLGMFFSSTLDTQLLLGLLMYFFMSPITQSALKNFSAAMGISDMRFFAIEHVAFMVLAVIFVHLGSIFSKKAADAVGKHRRAAIWYTLAMITVLAGIPWWRPLFPGL